MSSQSCCNSAESCSRERWHCSRMNTLVLASCSRAPSGNLCVSLVANCFNSVSSFSRMGSVSSSDAFEMISSSPRVFVFALSDMLRSSIREYTNINLHLQIKNKSWQTTTCIRNQYLSRLYLLSCNEYNNMLQSFRD